MRQPKPTGFNTFNTGKGFCIDYIETSENITFVQISFIGRGLSFLSTGRQVFISLSAVAIADRSGVIINVVNREPFGSASAVADSKQTLMCSYLSAALLAGLVLNSLLDWTWADPVAALVIAGFAVREGVEAWRGDACCATSAAALRGGGDTLCEDDCHTSENH